jgi:hypothetical protein
MKSLRIPLHSFVLAVANIIFIVVGFGIYQLLRPTNQIVVQASSATILCIFAFLFWSLSVRRLSGGSLSLVSRGDFRWTYVLALVWGVVIFVPLHYIGRGYLTSFANILGTWFFQVPTNFLALAAVKKCVRIV